MQKPIQDVSNFKLFTGTLVLMAASVELILNSRVGFLTLLLKIFILKELQKCHTDHESITANY